MPDSQHPNFNLANGRGYMLEETFGAAGRLNLQFFLWKDTFGFNIHPSIPVEHDAVIADVATGTAIWAIEVVREHPAASVLGLDIDFSKTPHKTWLPSNVTLRTWNLFDEVPEDLLGKFDLVHIRLLVLVVENRDPGPVLRNIMKLLKPGGYLQWDELNYVDMCVKTAHAPLKTPGLDRFRDMVYSEGRNNWTNELAKFATNEGFDNVSLHHYHDKPEFVGPHMENYFMVMHEFACRLEGSGLIEEGSKVKEIIQGAYQETHEGGAVFMSKVVCVARKPHEHDSTNTTSTSNASNWYRAEIGPRLKPVIENVYQKWAGLSGDALKTRIHDIRERAWAFAPYPCIGQFMWLLPSITTFSEYHSIIERAKKGATILDLACCFGQDLRLLASEGVPTENMYATDLVAELWDLGFEMFNDREIMKAQFFQADIFDSDSQLSQLDSKIDIIIACQFLHLFDWDKQVKAIKKINELSRPGTVVIGYQRAREEHLKVPFPWGEMFIHDPQTFRQIWEEASEGMKTTWKIDASLVDLKEWGLEEEDTVWMDPNPMGINFVITRLE